MNYNIVSLVPHSRFDYCNRVADGVCLVQSDSVVCCNGKKVHPEREIKMEDRGINTRWR